jgi:mono/diheme cytochrome c family protein
VVDARGAGPGFVPDNITPRGIVLQLGGGAWACFDTDLMRISAAWTGGAVTPQSMAQTSYQRWWRKSDAGERHLPKPAGPVWLANGVYPGWQAGEAPSAADPRTPAPSPAEVGRGALDPRTARFSAVGLEEGGARIEYTVGPTSVRERIESAPSPSGAPGLVRRIEIGPATGALLLVLASQAGPERITASVSAEAAEPDLRVLEQAGLLYLTIPAHGSELHFAVTLRGSDSGSAPAVAPVPSTIPRWTQVPTTAGRLSTSTSAYVVDNIDLPLANPWRRNVRPADIQFFDDGSAAIVTIDGDVWKVSGLGGDLSSIHWRRYASGFNEPLGLAIRQGVIFVFDRTGVWRLADTSGRGEADRYELFSNAFAQSAESRDYAAGIKLAPDGSFVISKGGIEDATRGKDNGTVIRISPDGRTAQRLGWGFRNPLIGVDPRSGLVTASDQEGNYVPATPLYVVEGDRYHGYLPAFVPREVYPAPIDPPLTWIPHNVCPSAVTQTWLRGARLGPLNDSLVLVSYYFPEIFRVMIDREGGRPQGAVTSITKDFRFAPLNAAVNPADGALYAVGLKIFGTAADQIAGLARVRYTGAPSLLASAVRPVTGGLLVEFDSAVDPASVRPEAFVVERWDYHRTAGYGSLHYLADGSVGQETLPVTQTAVSGDGRGVYLALSSMRTGPMQMAVRWALRSAGGAAMAGSAFFSPWALGPYHPRADDRVVLAGSPGGPTPAGGAPAASSGLEQGRRLTEAFGCIACHSTDGTLRAGPTWKGLYGQRVTLADGTSTIADEAYIRAHLRAHPKAMVRGFEAGMPDYSGLISDVQASALVEYLKSLR